ncbi:MAG: hypothetical protein ACHQQR_02770 [Gemmatimonadales bacterium]
MNLDRVSGDKDLAQHDLIGSEASREHERGRVIQYGVPVEASAFQQELSGIAVQHEELAMVTEAGDSAPNPVRDLARDLGGAG